MEKLGYVKRRRMPDNRKNVYVHLTPKGRALKNKLVPLAEEVNDIGLRGLNARERMLLRRGLTTIIDNLSGDSQ
jgi:MarR family transcriptional regulator, organic hydroperoxide resistance regulator